jgi:hypothetical protein
MSKHPSCKYCHVTTIQISHHKSGKGRGLRHTAFVEITHGHARATSAREKPRKQKGKYGPFQLVIDPLPPGGTPSPVAGQPMTVDIWANMNGANVTMTAGYDSTATNPVRDPAGDQGGWFHWVDRFRAPATGSHLYSVSATYTDPMGSQTIKKCSAPFITVP